MHGDGVFPAAAGAAYAAPGGNVLQLREHLVHDNIVREGLGGLAAVFFRPQLQLLHGFFHLLLPAYVAAQLLCFGAGQPHAAAVQHGLAAHLGLVRFAAQAAGHPQAKAQPVGLRPQLGFFTFAFYPHGGGRQRKACPLRQHGLFAVGAQVAETA